MMYSRKMSNDHPQHVNGKQNYFPQQVNPKCLGCEKLSKKFDLYKDAAQKQYNTIIDILKEHKALLDRIVNQDAVATKILSIFPVNSEEKLKELDDMLAVQRDTYIRQIAKLLGGNAERNLHNIFGSNIIMSFNVDGSFGKRRLRDFDNVFSALIDAISTFSESADKTLRASFQRQKKKIFKQTSRSKPKNKEQLPNESESSDILAQQNEIMSSWINEQNVNLGQTIEADKGAPGLTFGSKPSAYSKLFPIKSLKELDELENIINDDNVDELRAIVRLLIQPKGIIKNISFVMSVPCIMECNVDGHQNKRRLLNNPKFMDLIFRAAYDEGYSKKTFLDEFRRGFTMVKNRHHKNECLQRQMQHKRNEEQAENQESETDMEILPDHFVKIEETEKIYFD